MQQQNARASCSLPRRRKQRFSLYRGARCRYPAQGAEKTPTTSASTVEVLHRNQKNVQIVLMCINCLNSIATVINCNHIQLIKNFCVLTGLQSWLLIALLLSISPEVINLEEIRDNTRVYIQSKGISI